MELGILPDLNDCYLFGKPLLSSLVAFLAFYYVGGKLPFLVTFQQ